MAPRKKKDEVVVVSTAPAVRPQQELVLSGDPDKQIEFAQKAATALMKVVKPVQIQGKPYLQFGGWQTLARFFGATVAIEWTQKLVDDKEHLVGYEARAIVYQGGSIISSAEASCMCNEKRWKTAEEYAVKSMAQTRASAKALRNAFGWVAELAIDPSTNQKLQSTPAEEMNYDRSPIADDAHVYSSVDSEVAEAEYYSGGGNVSHVQAAIATAKEKGNYVDADTGQPITEAEYGYSMKFYGKPLSRASQQKNTRIK